jgi:hypothetical protein
MMENEGGAAVVIEQRRLRVIRDGDAGGGRRWQHRHGWQPTWNFTDAPLFGSRSIIAIQHFT